jgi:hypothetical protein
MDTSFKLTLTLATPFIMGASRTTLDGLLSAAIFREQGLMGEETISHIPLVSEAGIFKGSTLFCHPRYSHEVVGRVMSLRGRDDQDESLFKPNSRGANYKQIDTARGPHKTNLSSYQGINSPEVYFWGVGDPDRVVELIQNHIQGLGKRSNAGSGQIIGISWEEAEDQSWVTANGTPARPLPVDLWTEISDGKKAPVASIAVSLPYWNGQAVDAVSPQGFVA